MSYLEKVNRVNNIIGYLFIILYMGTCSGCVEARSGQAVPVLKGPYLGQKPPGMTPEIFASGIISTLAHEYSFTVSPDESEILFLMRRRA